MDFLSSSSLAILAEVADRDWSNECFLMFLFLREVLATDPFTSFTGPATKSNIKMKEGDSQKTEEDGTEEVRRRREMIQGRSGGKGEREVTHLQVARGRHLHLSVSCILAKSLLHLPSYLNLPHHPDWHMLQPLVNTKL